MIFIFKENGVQVIGSPWTPLALNMKIKTTMNVQHIMNHALHGSVRGIFSIHSRITLSSFLMTGLEEYLPTVFALPLL